MNKDHLNALQIRLSHEKGYLVSAKTENEKATRRVWISQIEKEIIAERNFLGLNPGEEPEMSDDDLLAALLS